MEKNYYDILEINKNASPEIVEKAYKTLVRKYHPDLQEQDKKEEFEEKLKIINEAYETLSDPQKREAYNAEIDYQENIEKQNNIQYNSNNINNKNYSNYQNNVNNQNTIDYEKEQKLYEREFNNKINEAINKAYHDAYIQDLKNRGYKIRYKKSIKDYFLTFISLLIFILLIFILIQIPFIKNFFIKLYEENFIIHHVVDIFINR